MTFPMFDKPHSAVPRMPHRPLPAAPSAPAWSKYRPGRSVRCDLCLRYLAEHDGDGPFPRDAKWKRTTGSETALSCHDHAQDLRHADRMPALPGPATPRPGSKGRR